MLKRVGKLTLLLTLLTSPVLAEQSTSVTVQDTALNLEVVNGIIEEGTTYITAQSLAQEFEMNLEYNATNDDITLTKDKLKIVMTIGLRTVTVNGKRSLLKSPVWLNAEGRAMLPMKFIADQLGLHVVWNQELKQSLVSEYLQHSVEEGETVAALSETYNVSVEQILNTNGMTDETLTPNNVIAIPVKANTPEIDTSLIMQYTDEELDLLSRIIYCESHGQPFDGQVAVGGVILNRVESSEYPNSVKDVIYQNYKGTYQFGPVKTGKINKVIPDKASIKAAKAALEGQDPSNGGYVFYNPKITTSSWFTSKPKTAQIGNHVFAK